MQIIRNALIILLLKLLDFLIILCDSCCRRHITALNLSQFIYKVFHSFALFSHKRYSADYSFV
mgnify:CR=1 FL=1